MSEPSFTKASYNEYLSQHRLMGSRCAQDGSVYLPPRAMCAQDFGAEMEWIEFSGRGKLAAFSIIYIGPSQMIEAGYDRKNPYCAAIIELEEGPKISAQLLGVDVFHPQTIQIGMAVQAEYVERGPEGQKQTFLAFHPA
jgi:uncharacterized OB-fold protein